MRAFRYESPLFRVLFDLLGSYKLGVTAICVQCSMLCSTVTDLPKRHSLLGPSWAQLGLYWGPAYMGCSLTQFVWGAL